MLWGPPPMLWPVSFSLPALLAHCIRLWGSGVAGPPQAHDAEASLNTGFLWRLPLHLSALAFWPEISPCVMASFTLPHPLDPRLIPVPRETSYTHTLCHCLPWRLSPCLVTLVRHPAPGQGSQRQQLRKGSAGQQCWLPELAVMAALHPQSAEPGVGPHGKKQNKPSICPLTACPVSSPASAIHSSSTCAAKTGPPTITRATVTATGTSGSSGRHASSCR